MQPMTPHCVLTLMLAIVFGDHFYSACKIQESCLGLVHTLLEHSLLTNTAHPQVLCFIGLFLVWWKKNDKKLGADRDEGQ